MQYASALLSLEPTPRPQTSAFGLLGGMNSGPDGANNWAQVPPTYMPWGNPAIPQPSLVRFTAEPLDKPGPSGLNASPFGQCKRKIEPEMSLPASKQLITEEKMAAHMRQLHISNNYTSHDEPAMAGTMAAKPELPVVVAPTVPAEDQAFKRLVLCEELRQLQSEPILPASLLSQMSYIRQRKCSVFALRPWLKRGVIRRQTMYSQIGCASVQHTSLPRQRPTMALVLWQPPAGKVGAALSQAASSTASEEMEDDRQRQPQTMAALFPSASTDNNNTSGTIDLNTVHRFGQRSFVSPSGTETMDL